MKKEEAIKIFAEKIKTYAKRRKVTQTELAALLEMTPSAVSQKFKCNILMNMNELKNICQAMKLASEETLELQTLLARIRAGEGGGTSSFNRFMKSCRRQKNITFNKLSLLSGISAVRLRSFEEDLNVVFSPADAEKLSKVYDIEPEVLLSKVPLAVPQEMVYKVDNGNNCALEFAESKAEYIPQHRRVPIIDAEEFKNYSGSVDLFAFGNMRSVSEMVYDIKRDVIGINVKSSVLRQPINGEFCLLVTDKMPFVHIAQLFFAMDADKNFYILHKKLNDGKFYLLEKDGSYRVFESELLWALAIVEVKFSPDLLV